MTDETREQIERHADAYVKRQGTHNRPDLTHHDFTKGATHQHPISYEAGKKDGINEAIDAVLYKLENLKATFKTYYDYVEFKEELEALKTEIKK